MKTEYIHQALAVAVMLALGLAALGACGNNCPAGNNGWCIAQPTNNSNINNNADVSCAGVAGQPNHAYVVKCLNLENGNIMQSADGFSTTPPPTGQSTWACTLRKPDPHWDNVRAKITLHPVGQTGDPPCIWVEFKNP